MKFLRIAIISAPVLFAGCAQVPKEAVKLSATVGRDLAEMREAHTELVKLHYEGLLQNINQFIDAVYLPYQINKTLSDEEIKQDMLATIDAAASPDASDQTRKDAAEKLRAFHIIIHEEVEDFRKSKLAPVKKEYKSVVAGINRSYKQIHYANSIVTGHLASVVKVHDAQNEILEELDINALRVKVGSNVTSLSDKIAELTAKAKEKERNLEKIIATFEELSEGVK